MKQILALVILTTLAACGTNWSANNGIIYVVPKQGKPGTSCTVESVLEGALISCEDGTSTLVKNGEKGDVGPVGATGLDGQSCTVQQVPEGDLVLPLGGAIISCPNGAALVSNGEQGEAGEDGEDGQNGQNGLDAIPVTVLKPCNASSNHSEVFLKLPSGEIVASFSQSHNGNYTRLTVLVPGVQYVTTDQLACYFQVDNEGNLINEHH